MAKKPVKPKINDEFMKALEASQEGFLYAFASDYGLPEQKGLVEVNKDMVSENGNAVRLTEAGRQYVASLTPIEQKESKETMGFEIMKAPERPERKRGRAPNIYPFDNLAEVGTGFFVPANGDPDKHVKRMISVANKASHVYATKVGEKAGKNGKVRATYSFSKKFSAFPHEMDGIKGAFVSRVQ